MEKFIEWLDKELESRGWTRAELARRAGVNQSTISMVYSGKRNIGPDLAEAISGALRIPADVVFRNAGLLPEAAMKNQKSEELAFLFNQLPPHEQERLVEYARFMVATVEKEQGKR